MRVLLLVLLLVSVVFAAASSTDSRPVNDPTYSVEEIQEEENPAVILHSFQGTYTSNSAYNQALYFCVAEDNSVSGSYDEVGIIQGQIKIRGNGGARMTGTFYEAGSYPCQSGTFSIDLTTWGFTGTYTCDGSGETFTFEEVRLSVVRPSDDQCAFLTEEGTAEGNWEDDSALPMSLCFEGQKKVEASYQNNPSPSYWANTWYDGYFEGTSYLGGRVVGGTWYETRGVSYDFKAGPVLYIARDNGYLQEWKWTGLAGGLGQTALDPTQFFDQSLHTVKNWRFKFGQNSALADCQAYDGNKNFVLTNMNDDDEDYYYFVGSDWFNSRFNGYDDLVGVDYLHPPLSGASALVAPLVVLALCLSLFI